MTEDHDHSHDHHGHEHHDHESHGHEGHSHGGHHHHGAPANFNRAFVIAIGLNSAFVLAEFVFGYIANSTALMSDAGHNLSDVLGLVLSLGAALLAKKAPTQRFTYGFRSSSILAALTNATVLLMATGAIGWETLMRFTAPPVVEGWTVTLVAAAGIVVNGVSAWLFVKGSSGDLNIKSAYLHMASDAAVSLGVVATGIVMALTGWYWLDPAVSLVIMAIIVSGTWGLLRSSMQLALNAVPESVDAAAVEAFLRQSSGVTDIHDLHIWGMSTTETALTAHLVIPSGYPGDAYLDALTHELKERFAITHSTLQVEQGSTDHDCALKAQA